MLRLHVGIKLHGNDAQMYTHLYICKPKLRTSLISQCFFQCNIDFGSHVTVICKTFFRKNLYLSSLKVKTICMFLDMDRSHGELTPAVMRKMVRLEGYPPLTNPRHRQRMQLSRGPEQDLQGILYNLGYHETISPL
jgi:hypothetical protein